jgi:hypothetical protein
VRKIRRIMISHSHNQYPTSFPYISGDGFRSLADYVHEKGNLLQPDQVKADSIVFVESELLEKYFQSVHPKIASPYILITHNGDVNIGKSFIKYIDSKIIHWFAQNVLVSHPKITPIPIGLENLRYYHSGITKIFDAQKKYPLERSQKKSRVLFGFNIQTNVPERQKAFDTLSVIKSGDQIESWPDPRDYLATLELYKFVASPPGNGVDCHRTWESLYMGVIPIVVRSFCMEYLTGLGLPIWIIDDWEELSDYDEKALNDKYDLIMNEANKNKIGELLDFTFWKELVAIKIK